MEFSVIFYTFSKEKMYFLHFYTQNLGYRNNIKKWKHFKRNSK